MVVNFGFLIAIIYLVTKMVREFKGMLGTFSTCFGNLSLGESGLNERQAKRYGFDYVVGKAEAPDRHPGKIKDATKLKIKLIFSRHSHLLLREVNR